jgi:hypothetical protein
MPLLKLLERRHDEHEIRNVKNRQDVGTQDLRLVECKGEGDERSHHECSSLSELHDGIRWI